MDRGHAVGAVRTDDRKIGHSHMLDGPFLNQACSLHASFITWKSLPNGIQ